MRGCPCKRPEGPSTAFGHRGDDLTTANLVIDDGRSVLAHSGEEIIDLLRGGQTVLNIVPLGGVVSELAAAITDLGLAAPPATRPPAPGSRPRRPTRTRPGLRQSATTA
jgi:hypothetical protein